MRPGHDEEFVKQIVRSLEAANNDLDDMTKARLSAARRRAVSSLTERRGLAWGAWPVGAVAVSMALVIGLWLWQHEPSLPPDGLSGFAELAALDEGIELYEDLDFYVWLSEQQADG